MNENNVVLELERIQIESLMEIEKKENISADVVDSKIVYLCYNNNMNNEFRFWKGDKITSMTGNNIFVFGSNPHGNHGAGAAKSAMDFGAWYGEGRGLYGNTYALVTKNLKRNYEEPKTGIIYKKIGKKSVSLEMISDNIKEMYECANSNPEKLFFIAYSANAENLNGYTSEEMWDAFTKDKSVPKNIRFHESFKPLAQKTLEAQKEKFTFFWTTISEFSQWHPSPFKYKDKQFICAEQFMMYSKAKLFGDEEVAQKIINFSNSHLGKSLINEELTSHEIANEKKHNRIWSAMMKNIKDLGREVKNYNEEIWISKREAIVSVGNREKFSQNILLKRSLLSTEGTTLVEASPYDRIWGIGLKSSDPRANDKNQWQGLNLLGNILTKLRNDFKLKAKPRNKIKS